MNPVRIRKDLLKLDKIELQALNDGFEALVAIEGPGGYQHVAGVYGKPGQPFRPTTPYLFLPWNRAYLLAFEQALDRLMPGLSLAYWDWTDGSTFVRGIPRRLRVVAYSDKDQGVWLNALCRAPIDFVGHDCYTKRVPGEPVDLEPVAQRAHEALSLTRYEEFATRIEEVSREFRAWVGGHLNDDDFSAYDPIFWIHRANLDRMWARWQGAHPEATVPRSLLNTTMEPFSVTVREMLDIKYLAYKYDDTSP